MASSTDRSTEFDTDAAIEAFEEGLSGRPFADDADPLPGPAASRAPDPSDHLAVGVQVLRDLLRIEDRPNRVRRVLRIWESKVSTAIRSRDLHAAEAWLRGVTADTAIPPEHAEAVGASIAALSRPALIDDLLVWLVHTDSVADAAGLFAEWGDPIVGRMIDLMALDDPPVNRRYMVDVLTMIGRSDSRLLAPHIGDHRWFIVRNVAIALGHSGRLATIPVLRNLLSHEDARVRVEAARGLATVDSEASVGDLITALSDPDGRVRQVAVSLLRACPSPDVVTRLSTVVVTGKISGPEAERLVEVIGERKDEAAREALEQIVARRGRHGAPKAIRVAAKHQLERRAS
ncbi:MAG: HEAT repeat domain-containing protein [Actinobacteria bacterium]|nr:HEAT repeat domain-containing protein [Actinomycetota bacterium]